MDGAQVAIPRRFSVSGLLPFDFSFETGQGLTYQRLVYVGDVGIDDNYIFVAPSVSYFFRF